MACHTEDITIPEFEVDEQAAWSLCTSNFLKKWLNTQLDVRYLLSQSAYHIQLVFILLSHNIEFR